MGLADGDEQKYFTHPVGAHPECAALAHSTGEPGGDAKLNYIFTPLFCIILDLGGEYSGLN